MDRTVTSFTCAVCGTTAGDDPPLDWVVTTERGELTAHCGRCARENLRAIEARLDPAYW